MDDNNRNLVFAKQHAASNHTQNFYKMNKLEAKKNKRVHDPGVSGYDFSIGKKNTSEGAVGMTTATSTFGPQTQMKDALDKAMDEHKLFVDVSD